MKWSMDTHKYMSEITRKALQVLAECNINGESEPDEIERAERKLAEAGVYKDFDGAKGRIRRALFTYFKAYDCMNANCGLTEVGSAFVENKLSIQEISFYYVTNYLYEEAESKYYPLQMILKCLISLFDENPSNAYLTSYDFSKIVECDSYEQINDELVSKIKEAHTTEVPAVNERAIGYDVWAKMLTQAGIVDFEEHNLKLTNIELARWILKSYSEPIIRERGSLTSGVLNFLPTISTEKSKGNPAAFADEGQALQAFLFDSVSPKVIDKYITLDPKCSLSKMKDALGLNQAHEGHYSAFSGLERLVGRALYKNGIGLQKAIGEILLNIEVTEKEDFEEMIEAEQLKSTYTVAELGAILGQMYESAENKTTAIHMFGLKYGEIIKANNYSTTAIVEASGLSGTYQVEIGKGIRLFESIARNEFGVKFYKEGETAKSSTKTFPVLKPRTRKNFPLNSILYGAPGTGKTYSTAQYALAIAENRDYESLLEESREDIMARYNALVTSGRIVFTTFHQNYGYEDFIQGIRPDTSVGNMSFKTVDGVFKSIADKAMEDASNDYIIIIDEINRANISKVFGELITLIEDDKRWGEVNAIDATLPSGESFAVPNNLYILGTMNSADKSISLIDTALRRRFDFVEYEPKSELIADSDLRKVLEKLNTGISSELGSTDLLIGHSYFMNKTINDLCGIMNRNIIPLLYEYFFDNQKKVEAQIKAATDGYPVEVKSGTVGRIKLVKKGVE